MRFVRKKLVQLIVVMLCVTFFSFLLLELLPGDTATTLCAGAGGTECIEQKTEEFHLNDPMPVRYVRWLGGVVTGDFGSSARNAQPVSEALQQRMPSNWKS